MPSNLHPFSAVREVYDNVSPGWKGRCTAPLLVDRIERRIVSNESSDIVALINAMRLPGCNSVDLRPPSLATPIDQMCEKVQLI
jgi:putative glutathione S-transferase